MAEVHLKTPLTEADVRKLKIEDTVYIDGHVFGIRDATQIRMFDEGVRAPADMTGGVCIHTAPNVKRGANGKWEKVCIGTTTSTRMNRFYPPLMRDYGVRAMIGKGGFLQDTVDAMKEVGGVYLAIVGGAAALETMQIEEIEEVWWEDLMPECLWKFRVKAFGPLIVAIDANGNSLYKTIKDQAAEKMKAMGL
ncbi:MAG TPA: FumA C-terminus/TtdB family hydratase beta subunit [Tepidisphaeraceae bacterium]|jgi:L(+)-tartrate dehydratase beta subunit|nr:FumA C-terminus/TtdB family hydratase beta subunit [Tepidisphaeraceae bacterium]